MNVARLPRNIRHVVKRRNGADRTAPFAWRGVVWGVSEHAVMIRCPEAS